MNIFPHFEFDVQGAVELKPRGAIMQQPCPRCGYTPDRPSRFCRQCGAPQFEETESTSAETRNYGIGQPPPAQQYQSPASGHSPTEQTPPTVRFYQPPIQNYSPSPMFHAPEPPKKSRAGLWILIALLTLGLVGAGMVGMVTYAIKSRQQYTQNVPISVPEPPEPPEPPDVEPPAPPSGPAVPAENLTKFQYPGAKVNKTVNTFGVNVLTLQTSDSVEKVKAFYQKLVGSPMVETTEDKEHTVVFNSSGPPMVLITIKPHDQDKAQTEITIVRTPVILPKM
jgi:hypothetical protein